MKKIIFITIAIITAVASCSNENQKDKAQLYGTLEMHKNGMIWLESVDGQSLTTIDSTKIDEKGVFSFSKKVPTKDFYRIRVSDNNNFFMVLDPEENIKYTNAEMMLSADYSIEGSAEGDIIMKLQNIRTELNTNREALLEKLNKAEVYLRDSVQKAVENEYTAMLQSKVNEIKNLADKNPDKLSLISAVEFLNPDTEFETLNKIASNVEKNYPNSGYAQGFINRIKQMKATAIGSPAPEISFPNPEGENVALSSLKGKYVLIDFWASWCGPCRKENPNVVKLYNYYKDKGFEIYAVSLDKDKNAWINAIKQDKLTWTHVSDLSMWSSPVVKQYGFSGIPFTVLVDKDGNIIAKGLRGQQLENKLAELMN
jgi:peroxiredoxin